MEDCVPGARTVRRVRTDGSIKWGGDLVFIAEPLAGETVGIAETESGHWIVRFFDIDLGIIDTRPRNFTASGQPDRDARKQNKP